MKFRVFLVLLLMLFLGGVMLDLVVHEVTHFVLADGHAIGICLGSCMFGENEIVFGGVTYMTEGAPEIALNELLVHTISHLVMIFFIGYGLWNLLLLYKPRKVKK